jgi:hypothetical protein
LWRLSGLKCLCFESERLHELFNSGFEFLLSRELVSLFKVFLGLIESIFLFFDVLQDKENADERLFVLLMTSVGQLNFFDTCKENFNCLLVFFILNASLCYLQSEDHIVFFFLIIVASYQAINGLIIFLIFPHCITHLDVLLKFLRWGIAS